MKPDGTSSFSTADEKLVSPEGNHVTEPDVNTGPAIKKYRHSDGTTWSYIFVHNSKVKKLEMLLEEDGRTYFVHKTVRYFRKQGKHKVRHQEVPTVSGLVFFQGYPKEIQAYLDQYIPNVRLCKNCSTGKVAEIPDAQMQPFMRVAETSPDRIRFLLHPYHYYARNRILLRITTGELAGLEGYIIRIDRDRRLVMDVGGLSVANLQERQVLIDRYFHPVKDDKEVALQAENIDYLRKYALDELSNTRITHNDAWNIYSFIIEEIGYYYSPFVEQFKEHLNPIMREGSKVLQEMEQIISNPHITPNNKPRYESDYQRLLSQYEYLF